MLVEAKQQKTTNIPILFLTIDFRMHGIDPEKNRLRCCDLNHCSLGDAEMIAVATRQAGKTDAKAAHQTWKHSPTGCGTLPKLAALIDESAHDVLAHFIPRRKISSNRPWTLLTLINAPPQFRE
jgi:hypothetical protein